VRERTWISLGVGLLTLLWPVAAEAASGRVRLLNAGPSGAVTLRVDGTAKATRIPARGVSARFTLRAGVHTFQALRGSRVVTERSIGVQSGQRVTVVYTLAAGHPLLRLLREPGGIGSGTLVRVANYASRAGVVDVRVGPLTVARGLGVGHVSVARRVTSALSPTGTIAVSARRKTGATFTASGKLVLATRSVGLFALVPTTSGARLIRLPYDITPPTPKALPAVTGTRRFDHSVTCGKGTWTPKASRIARRWTIDGTGVPGGASLRLTTAAAAGHVVGCSVTASSRGMTTRVRTTFALPSVPTPIVPPAILVPSELTNGDDVTCDVGRWAGSPTDFTVRWVRVATRQVVGTGFTYTLRLPADNGGANVVVCEVAAVNDGGPSVARQSLNSVALNIAPTITIRTGPTGTVPSTGFAFFTFAIGGGGAKTVTGSFDGVPVQCDLAGCQVNFAVDQGPNAAAHTFIATASNGAGSTPSSPRTWSVNPPLPGLMDLAGASPATANPATFTWTATEGVASSSECSVDNGAFTPCGAGTPGTADVTFSPAPPEGVVHPVRVRLRNAAGVSPAALVNWQFNPLAAAITNVTVNPPPGSPSAKFRVVVTLTGGAVNLTCVIDGNPPVKCGPNDPMLDDPIGNNVPQHSVIVTASNINGTFIAPQFDWVYN
jgi:hypothetical protein